MGGFDVPTPLPYPRARPPAPAVAEWAESRLRQNAYLALKNISCEFHDGVLTLQGCVPTYYLKQVAQEVVAPVEGVERVENRIEVLAPALSAAGRA